MKKSVFAFFAASLCLAACQIEDVEPNAYDTSDNVLSAQIEQNEVTKTVLGESNNVLWSENDQIVAFMKSSYGHKYQIKPSFAGKTYADFSRVSAASGDDLSAGIEWDHNVAYYPYSKSIECVKSGDNYTFEVVLPAEQTYEENSFGNGFFPMVAVSEDNNITFKNVCGGIKLQLKGTQKVVSVKLQGKNNERLSGDAGITAYTDGTKPVIKMASTASTSVTLNCGFGVQLNESTATDFIIALPPMVFSKGFTVTVIDSEGEERTIATDKENVVPRSSLLVMPEVTFARIAQPGDYVDEYGINHGQGVKIGETVWAPVHCGYHATDYKYGKLYQWGRKYGQGYNGQIYDVEGNSVGQYSDYIVPEIKEGVTTSLEGNYESNANVFYKNSSDWVDAMADWLWSAGTEADPLKAEYDPCPEGWRIPTVAELNELCQNHSSWTTDKNGHYGYWFTGKSLYAADVPQVFFPAAGCRTSVGNSFNRGKGGSCWSSTPAGGSVYLLDYNSTEVKIIKARRGYGDSVRCVQDNSSESSDQEVELVCALPARDTKSVGLDEFNNMYLVGDDFVDVNGVDYPIKGDGTNVFVVKVPKADSYTVSYPADAVKMNNDGTITVSYPSELNEEHSLGIFVGKCTSEDSGCRLISASAIVKVSLSEDADLKSCAFTSNSGTPVCGDVIYELTTDGIQMIGETQNGNDTVTVNLSSKTDTIYLPVSPCTLDGMTLSFTYSDGMNITKSNNSSITLKRSYIANIKLTL